MTNAFELLAISLGAGACWVLWFYFVKEQRVAAFREELFTIRRDLFDLAVNGKLDFDSRSYFELREFINGMLRFGHHISLRSSLIAVRLAEIDPDKLGSYGRWQAAVETQPEDVRANLISIHHRMVRAYRNYLVHGSIILSLLAFAFIVRAVFSALWSSFFSPKRPSRFDLMDIAINQIANSFNAQALEEQAYRNQNDVDMQTA